MDNKEKTEKNIKRLEAEIKKSNKTINLSKGCIKNEMIFSCVPAIILFYIVYFLVSKFFDPFYTWFAAPMFGMGASGYFLHTRLEIIKNYIETIEDEKYAIARMNKELATLKNLLEYDVEFRQDELMENNNTDNKTFEFGNSKAGLDNKPSAMMTKEEIDEMWLDTGEMLKKWKEEDAEEEFERALNAGITDGIFEYDPVEVKDNVKVTSNDNSKTGSSLNKKVDNNKTLEATIKEKKDDVEISHIVKPTAISREDAMPAAIPKRPGESGKQFDDVFAPFMSSKKETVEHQTSAHKPYKNDDIFCDDLYAPMVSDEQIQKKLEEEKRRIEREKPFSLTPELLKKLENDMYELKIKKREQMEEELFAKGYLSDEELEERRLKEEEESLIRWLTAPYGDIVNDDGTKEDGARGDGSTNRKR